MGISKEEAIKELQNRETVFVAYSQATKLPYVKCDEETYNCLLYTSPSPRDRQKSRMPSSA